LRLSKWRGLMNGISRFSGVLKSPGETLAIAAELAKLCKIGDCILLYGDVGVGKTTFARGFIKAVAKSDEEIVSPTFTLVQTYPLMSGGMVWHCDLYRLKNKNELFELGLDEAFDNGIILIEWPELATNQVLQNSLSVRLDISGQGRSIIISGNSDVWKDRIKKLDMLKNT
jgi:tRNA threonylcarbamoyladenosine biosynthesis protein TsaE